MINVFNINLILLCIGIDITQDEEERNFIIGLYHQFLIYLVMVSININQQEKCHDFIQEKIYMSLGFGYLFLHNRDRKRCEEITDNLLAPIFEDISAELSKNKIKTLFSKKIFLKIQQLSNYSNILKN